MSDVFVSGWFHEHLRCERSLTHYTLTLEDSQRLRRVPSSAVDVCGSATSPWAAGSTFQRATNLGRGAHQQRCGTVVGTGCTGRAPARPHATAKQSRLAATERWSISSAQRPPAAHGEQVAVRLCCVRAGRAVSGSGAWSVVAVAPSSMASTARMGLKPASHGSHHWPPEVLILQRRRWMDAAAQARGPSHGRALQLQSSPMRFVTPHTCAGVTNRSRPPSLWSAGAREGPRRAMPQVNVLSPFQRRSSWNYP